MSSELDEPGIEQRRIERRDGRCETDALTREEPLEIRIGGESFLVTMRTPGDDEALTVGLLFAEGIIDGADEVVSLCQVDEESLLEAGEIAALCGGRMEVELVPEALQRAQGLGERSAAATAACGVCGKRSLEDLHLEVDPVHAPELDWSWIAGLPAALRERQTTFARTGGAHAAGLAVAGGAIGLVAEDVGRHNAVDKVIGRTLLDRRDLEGGVLVTSGRAGYEIVQKALRARLGAVVSVGAASSLAARLAEASGMGLYCFVGAETGHRHVAAPRP